ncbi:MAG: hypothetical protein ABSG86_01435 [Thermoguttaceae bacterium]|jgi:hypothetical protein
MATDLRNFLATQIGDGPFRPYLAISREADALTAYFEPDADYSERLTDHVTLYRSIESKEIVGCRIKGISGILEDLPNFLQVEHQGAKLSMVFWSFRGGVDDENLRDAFRQLAKAAGDMSLQTA